MNTRRVRKQSEKNILFNNYIFNNCKKENFDDYLIYSYDYDDIEMIKYLIINNLSEQELTMFLTYTDLGNLRETAQKFGVSLGKIQQIIKGIKDKIKNIIKENNLKII